MWSKSFGVGRNGGYARGIRKINMNKAWSDGMIEILFGEKQVNW